MNQTVGIIGTGAVGTAIGILLQRAGYTLVGVHDIESSQAAKIVERTGCPFFTETAELARQAEILFVTTYDAQIQSVVDALAQQQAFHPGQTVIHTSGAQSSRIMASAGALNAYLLSLHPLQSFAGQDMAIENIPGSVFSIEGDPAAYDIAVAIVEALAGEYFFIDQQSKPVYHAGACAVSNYLVGLMHLGVQLLISAGVPEELAGKALLPLLKGTVHNLETMPLPAALTGPIARGDAETIEKQLSAMDELAPEMVSLYRALGLYTLQVAEAKGTDPVRLQQIRTCLAAPGPRL
jgi:predicted short-subunit dehydrogenase-like oxidoreductase (DUF2520 family)